MKNIHTQEQKLFMAYLRISFIQQPIYAAETVSDNFLVKLYYKSIFAYLLFVNLFFYFMAILFSIIIDPVFINVVFVSSHKIYIEPLELIDDGIPFSSSIQSNHFYYVTVIRGVNSTNKLENVGYFVYYVYMTPWNFQNILICTFTL